MSFITTSRFSTETWEQNKKYREKCVPGGCIYGTPLEISERIPLDSTVFVVEMNNTTNKILGIGLIKNLVQYDKYYSIYQAGNYNRYIYKGTQHLSREDIEAKCPLLITIFDHICFKEKTHLKRGAGIMLIPDKLLAHKIAQERNVYKELSILFRQNNS